jgi:hypothetical protein
LLFVVINIAFNFTQREHGGTAQGVCMSDGELGERGDHVGTLRVACARCPD